VSYIFLADRLLELPLSLVSVSLGTALLPVLSELWSRKAQAEFKNTVNYNLRLNILLSGAAGTGLFMLALPIVNMLFQRGKFTPDEAIITAEVVEVYSLLVVTTSCVRVLVPSFYAIRNTWLPAVISGICLLIHIVVAPLLMERYGLFGLNFSSVVTAGLNLLLLFVCFQWLFGGIGYGQLIVSIFKSICCCLLLAVGLRSHGWLLTFFGVTLGGQMLAFLSAGLLGLILFLIAGWLVRMQEMTFILSRLYGKIKSRWARSAS
jgi:putative peptidoglycan lipid II flippase